MQYELQVFHFDGTDRIRTAMLDGEPWFVGKDATTLLGYANPQKAVRDHCRAARPAGVNDSFTPPLDPQTLIIPERDLYRLIMRSKLPAAERFEDWIVSDVIPSIRKTGAYGTQQQRALLPRFFKRYNLNQGRVDRGYFSVIGILAVHVYGRLEYEGHLMADNAPNGTENRPDVAVGRRFSDWLKANHPDVQDCFTYYMHWTPKKEVEARQYPLSMYGLFITFLDEVWVPDCSQDYFKTRDPAALAYLPKLLASPDKPRPGMMRQRTLGRRPKRKRRKPSP